MFFGLFGQINKIDEVDYYISKYCYITVTLLIQLNNI
jgi:hypothetical protein